MLCSSLWINTCFLLVWWLIHALFWFVYGVSCMVSKLDIQIAFWLLFPSKLPCLICVLRWGGVAQTYGRRVQVCMYTHVQYVYTCAIRIHVHSLTQAHTCMHKTTEETSWKSPRGWTLLAGKLRYTCWSLTCSNSGEWYFARQTSGDLCMHVLHHFRCTQKFIYTGILVWGLALVKWMLSNIVHVSVGQVYEHIFGLALGQFYKLSASLL